jgi:hypothetical protein
MIFNVPLSPGTSLGNVVYRWIANGARGSETTAGLTQPDTDRPVFRIDCTPPAGAEEIEVYDSTDAGNWNVGNYLIRLIADTILAADQLFLANLFVPTAAPVQVIPAPTQDKSICRCYGSFKDPSGKASEGVPVKFTLVQADPSDPNNFIPLDATPLKSSQFVTDRSIDASIVSGQLTDADGNQYQDLLRNDFITPSGTKYLVESEALGAITGLSLLTAGGPSTGSPVLIELRRRSFDLSRIGDVLLGELTIS